MTKIKTILIDDEESARNILSNLLLKFCPQIQVVATFSNVEQAVKGIKLYKPDLVFLDVEMPNYAGYELVNFFTSIYFEIIFVTAYDHYALKAFEVSAIDYILKPIEIDRLQKAVDRVIKRKTKQSGLALDHLKKSLNESTLSSIVVVKNNYQHIVEVKDIIAIEAQESYSVIHTKQKTYLTSKNLKHYENIFEGHPQIIRIHKSWIIHLEYLLSYSKSKFEVHLSNNIIAKLSKYKKTQFEEYLNKI